MNKFDWKVALSNFTLAQARTLAAERGLDPLTFEGLHNRGLIGSVYVRKFNARCVAFPIQNKNGDVYRAHARAPQPDTNGKWDWVYEPISDPLLRPISAFAIGNPATANQVFIFESPWDGIAAIEWLALSPEIDSGEVCIVATRGAANAAKIKPITFASGASLYAFPQNDPAGTKWLDDIITITGGCYVAETPQPHKDLGEWVKNGGATPADLDAAIQYANLQKPQAPTDPTQKLFQELLAKYRAALLTSEQLETAPIKPRTKLLGEWFWEGDLGFVFGERGIGKTWFVDGLAVHLSIGTDFDSWTVPKAVPVLYLDGEMPQDSTRDRLKGLAPGNKNLILLHHEELFNSTGLTMNLADPLTQKVVTELCVEKATKVLILDNLSCLVSGVKENDADAWEQLSHWLLELRRRRIAIIIVHHAGVSGRMRGTTKREDPAAWVIKLEATEAIDPSEPGAKFEMSFSKIRTTSNAEWIRIWHFKTEANGQVSIGCQEISFDGKVLQLIQAGLETASEIADEIGCNKSTVSKAAKRLEAKQLIVIRKRRYYPRFMNQP